MNLVVNVIYDFPWSCHYIAATSALARVPVNATYTGDPLVSNGPTSPVAVPIEAANVQMAPPSPEAP